MVPRKLGKADLRLPNIERAKSEDARPGWDPLPWSVDHAGRTLLLLAAPGDPRELFLKNLDRLFSSGEVGELVALYQALPLLPHQSDHVLRAAEGVRTNIKPVFTAIAHRNPYPAERFDEASWNQMILKCLFIDVPLWPVVGIDERVNAPLMRMLCDYAHERWAASRPVSPELWRCVGPVADDSAIADLERTLEQGFEPEREAALLALSSSSHPRAVELVKERPEFSTAIASGRLTWNKLASTR